MNNTDAMERLNRFNAYYNKVNDTYVTSITEVDIEAINTGISAIKTIEDMPRDFLRYYEIGKRAEQQGFNPDADFMNPPETKGTEFNMLIAMNIGTDGNRYISAISAKEIYNCDYRTMIADAKGLHNINDEVYAIKFDPNHKEFIDTCVSYSFQKFI